MYAISVFCYDKSGGVLGMVMFDVLCGGCVVCAKKFF